MSGSAPGSPPPPPPSPPRVRATVLSWCRHTKQRNASSSESPPNGPRQFSDDNEEGEKKIILNVLHSPAKIPMCSEAWKDGAVVFSSSISLGARRAPSRIRHRNSRDGDHVRQKKKEKKMEKQKKKTNETYDSVRVSRRQGWNLIMSACPPVFHCSNHSVYQWQSQCESLTSGGEAEAVRAVLQMLQHQHQHQHHLDTAAAFTPLPPDSASVCVQRAPVWDAGRCWQDAARKGGKIYINIFRFRCFSNPDFVF